MAVMELIRLTTLCGWRDSGHMDSAKTWKACSGELVDVIERKPRLKRALVRSVINRGFGGWVDFDGLEPIAS